MCRNYMSEFKKDSVADQELEKDSGSRMFKGKLGTFLAIILILLCFVAFCFGTLIKAQLFSGSELFSSQNIKITAGLLLIVVIAGLLGGFSDSNSKNKEKNQST